MASLSTCVRSRQELCLGWVLALSEGRRDTELEQQAGPAHICDKDTGKKITGRAKIRRVIDELRASSSALLNHLLKMLKRKSGNVLGVESLKL